MCIILCSFCGCIMSGFEGIEGVETSKLPLSRRNPKIDIICEGPQTNIVPQNVAFREDLISKNISAKWTLGTI